MQRIGDDRAHHNSGHLRRRDDAVFLIQLRDDRTGTAAALIAVKNRIGGFNIANVMVINNFLDLRVVNVVDRLIFSRVIDQNKLLAAIVQQVIAGNRADRFAFDIQHRIAAVAGVRHFLRNVVNIFVVLECDWIAAHQAFHREGFVDDLGDLHRIPWRADHRTVLFTRKFKIVRADLLIACDDHAPRAHFQQLPLLAVAIGENRDRMAEVLLKLCAVVERDDEHLAVGLEILRFVVDLAVDRFGQRGQRSGFHQLMHQLVAHHPRRRQVGRGHNPGQLLLLIQYEQRFVAGLEQNVPSFLQRGLGRDQGWFVDVDIAQLRPRVF